MTTTYGGTTIAARTHLPINTKPIRIPGRPAPDLSPDRWAIRSPWTGTTVDPAGERAALTKIATQQKEENRRGRTRSNATHLAALNAAQRMARDTRIRDVPPDQWSDRPIHVTTERAQLAQAVADTVLAGSSLGAAATTHGVSFGTAEKWISHGWTTTPPGNRPALAFATPPDQATLAALKHATQLIADGMGRADAAKAAGVSIRRLREHLGTPNTGRAERVAHAAALVAEGMTRENAARTAGCTRNNLRAHLGFAKKDAA